MLLQDLQIPLLTSSFKSLHLLQRHFTCIALGETASNQKSAVQRICWASGIVTAASPYEWTYYYYDHLFDLRRYLLLGLRDWIWLGRWHLQSAGSTTQIPSLDEQQKMRYSHRIRGDQLIEYKLFWAPAGLRFRQHRPRRWVLQGSPAEFNDGGADVYTLLCTRVRYSHRTLV